MVNNTEIKLLKRHTLLLKSLQKEGKEFIATLHECCCHQFTLEHEVRVKGAKELRNQLEEVVLLEKDEYIEIFGSDNLDLYEEDYNAIYKEYIRMRQASYNTICKKILSSNVYKGNPYHLRKYIEAADQYYRLDLKAMMFAEPKDLEYDINGLVSNAKVKGKTFTFGTFIPRHSW